MAILVVDRLLKRFGSVAAVNGISFEVGSGEFLSLLGPSGCGKTTTLRCIAGFEHPDGGRIMLDGETLADPERGIFTPPNKRHFGMVFQSYAVWPHMTVFHNVAYPLSVKTKFSARTIRDRVHDKLQTVGLDGLADRYPSQLSGGQQQRVALARALVMEPRALLFDEPLSNLDAKLRERMRFELIEIQSTLGIPAVYVTHDQAEAMVMSRRVIVMEKGDIAQIGCPDEIYARPNTRFVADFIGLSNFIDAEVVSQLDEERWRVRCAFGELECVSGRVLKECEPVLLVVRPERVELSASPSSGPNCFAVELRNRYFLGPHLEYFLSLGGTVLRAQSSAAVGEIGKTLHVRIAPSDCRVVPRDNPAESDTDIVQNSAATPVRAPEFVAPT